MTPAASHSTRAATHSPEAPCAHCGLPVGPHPAGDDPWFCCTGCAVVYDALHAAGFGDRYYTLRTWAPDRHQPTPADPSVDALQLAELDTDAFLEQHTRPLGDDGTRRVELFVDGVHCAACVWLVEQLPYQLDGVGAARLDLPRARLTLDFAPAAVRLSTVTRWLSRFGYQVHPSRRQGLARRTEAERRLLLKMGICWALAGNVMLLAFALYAGLDFTNDPTLATATRWASLALAVPAVLYGGSEFFRRAWASFRLAVRTRSLLALHMDTPISLGILVGFTHSAWATLSGRGEVWFDSITVLIAALLTARWLQLRSRRLAGDATERLLALLPSMARRVDAGGHAAPARIEEVRPGDLIEVPAGEVFPVDGLVEHGQTAVNKAVLTGESRPEPAAPGTLVEAGVTNLRAPVRLRVVATGEQTRVGRLLAWIRSQDCQKAPVVLLADRLSGYFVVAVLALAALTAALWLSLDPSSAAQHVVALLVISCPCALGMATPLAMAVAAGQAARAGIFVKSDEATEQLARVSTVVLDKTGTLTEGRMTVADLTGDPEALALAAALEAQSNHPIAAAFIQAAPLHGDAMLAVEAFEAVGGAGIHGRIGGRAVAVGRPGWIARQTGQPLSPALAAARDRHAERGHTPVAVAVDGQCTTVLAVGDRMRTGSAAALAALRARGTTLHVLSGDHPAVVAAAARSLGIDPARAHGHASPEAKRRFVEQLRQDTGATVMMVGDGVNDAAALQAADVGVAVHGGSTASLVAADVFMTREGLQPIAELLAGARRVMAVIRRNLALSLVYNVAGAAAAMLGLVTPLVAAVAMPLSSLLVVTSSLAQRSFRPTQPVPALEAAPPAAVQSAPAAAPSVAA